MSFNTVPNGRQEDLHRPQVEGYHQRRCAPAGQRSVSKINRSIGDGGAASRARSATLCQINRSIADGGVASRARSATLCQINRSIADDGVASFMTRDSGFSIHRFAGATQYSVPGCLGPRRAIIIAQRPVRYDAMSCDAPLCTHTPTIREWAAMNCVLGKHVVLAICVFTSRNAAIVLVRAGTDTRRRRGQQRRVPSVTHTNTHTRGVSLYARVSEYGAHGCAPVRVNRPSLTRIRTYTLLHEQVCWYTCRLYSARRCTRSISRADVHVGSHAPVRFMGMHAQRSVDARLTRLLPKAKQNKDERHPAPRCGSRACIRSMQHPFVDGAHQRFRAAFS